MCNCKANPKMLLKYNTSVKKYSSAYNIQWDQYLNGFEVFNSGTTDLYLNNSLIPPGESKSIGGNYGEVYCGRLDIKFVTPSPAPPTVTNEMEITQKFYIFEDII
jgi:hypothetical protein